jgi:PmbA protein
MSGTDEIIDRAIGILKTKAIDGYEVYLDQSSHFEVEAKEGVVDTFQASHSWGMAFRILNHQRIGFSYVTSTSPQDLQKVIEEAIGSSEATAPDPCFDFAPDFENPPPRLPIFDERLDEVPEAKKIETAKALEEAALSVDPGRIRKVRKAAYQEVFSRTTLVNSNGLHFSYRDTLASISVTAVAESSGESEIGWDFDFSHFFSDLEAGKVGERAARNALEGLGGKRIASGAYPVLLRSELASEFLSLLAHSFLAEQVHKGKSLLKGKKGVRYLSPLLSIVDDGLHAKGMSTSPVDGEGMPSRRTPLVIRGEITGYLYDRYWANRENGFYPEPQVASTGNSRRSSIKAPPGIGPSNFFVEPGNESVAALMQKLDRGVVLKEVMGLHTVDPISGDFSLGCSGDWVEKGERVHPVKSIAVAGNLFRLFTNIIGIGDDFRFLGRMGSPSLLVEGLEISGN